MPNLREEEPSSVVDLGLDRLLQDALEDLAGQPMLAVREIQAAEHELGFGAVIVELATLLRGHEARQRREIIFLEELEQDLAIGEILDDDAVVLVTRHRV